MYDPAMDPRNSECDISDVELEDKYALPKDTAVLTVLFNSPTMFEVTPGPPLNCRSEPSKGGTVLRSFQPGYMVGVVGPAIVGGAYGGPDGTANNLWLPVLTEIAQPEGHEQTNISSTSVSVISQVLKKRRGRTTPEEERVLHSHGAGVGERARAGAGAGTNDPVGAAGKDANSPVSSGATSAAGTNRKKQPNTRVAKAWCGCGSESDPYLVPVGALKKQQLQSSNLEPELGNERNGDD